MTAPIVKFAEAPRMIRNEPDCEACSVTVESDGDGYQCPTCGTHWSYDHDEDAPGTLYEEWSGVELDLEISDPDDAWHVTIAANRERRGW